VKASGEIEPFAEDKLRRSLQRSGAKPAVVDGVVLAVTEKLYPGITTKALYRLAHRELKRAARPSALRYRLKRAIMELGPSGFPFERLIAAMFAAEGYRCQVDLTLRGACVHHEVDVVAEKGREKILVECKYRNQPGYRTDVKVALYVGARAADLASTEAGRHDSFWLVTNAKFTADAAQYGACAGLRLLGWDFPARDGLERRLERHGLFPLTCLSSLSRSDKKRLLESGLILLSDLGERPDELNRLGNAVWVERVLSELAESAHSLGDSRSG
jgi:hypothetical protein